MFAQSLLQCLRRAPNFSHVVSAFDGIAGIYVVGGAVRDVLLDRQLSDLDFACECDVTQLTPSLEANGAQIKVVHERFKTLTATIHGIEFDVASTRIENYAAPGALPDVEIGVTIERDLERRDFSINAIAVEIEGGRVVSHEYADQDFDQRRLRVLHGLSFIDDPTRLFRAARYGARFEFELETETARLAKEAVQSDALATLSSARVGAQLELVLRESQPEALRWLNDLKIADKLFGKKFDFDPYLIASAINGGEFDQVVALAACCRRFDEASLRATLSENGLAQALFKQIVNAATQAQMIAERLDLSLSNSQLWHALRDVPAATLQLAGALTGAKGKANLTTFNELMAQIQLAVIASDLLKAGLVGRQIGAGLDAAFELALDDRTASGADQLAAAIERGRRLDP